MVTAGNSPSFALGTLGEAVNVAATSAAATTTTLLLDSSLALSPPGPANRVQELSTRSLACVLTRRVCPVCYLSLGAFNVVCFPTRGAGSRSWSYRSREEAA